MKPSELQIGLALLSWISVFAEVWLLLLGSIEGGPLAWFSLAFFFVIAIIATAYDPNLKKGSKK